MKRPVLSVSLWLICAAVLAQTNLNSIRLHGYVIAAPAPAASAMKTHDGNVHCGACIVAG